MSRKNTAEITLQRSYQVVKANEMIQKARYDLNITELKTLAFIISKIKPTDTVLQEYSFSILEYCKVCGIEHDNGGNYQYIRKILKGMRDKSFWIVREDGALTTVGWLQTVTVHPGSGKVTVKLDDKMQKYVLGLFENFTQYELMSTLPMKSAYSFRMYELLKSYAFTGEHAFDIEDLKQQLVAERYKNFKDFRKKVIEIAVKEINLYTDLEVSWTTETCGRKVTNVIFYIKQRDEWGRLNAWANAERQLDGQTSLF